MSCTDLSQKPAANESEALKKTTMYNSCSPELEIYIDLLHVQPAFFSIFFTNVFLPCAVFVRNVTYLTGDSAIVVKIIQSEGPFLPVIFFNRHITLQFLRNTQTCIRLTKTKRLVCYLKHALSEDAFPREKSLKVPFFSRDG